MPTVEKLAEAVKTSEVRYRRLFETAKDGILILDAVDGKILDANPFMTELTGFARDEFVGQELWKIGLFEDEGASLEMFLELQRTEFVRYDHLPLRAKDGHRVDVEFVSNVYQVENRVVAQCNIRDIRERLRLEKQALEHTQELADLHRRKDEFMAMLSHELRGPLSPIANAVHVLNLDKGENPVQREAKAIIDRQVTRLTRLVDDLLEVARITTGSVQLTLEKIAVAGIVEHAVETVQALMRRRRHVFNVDLPPEPVWLIADAGRMEQVLVNLLTNAAKYTEEAGLITLTVRQEGDECVIRVRDSGVGIASELLPRIFDLFTQGGRSLSRSEGGLGVGLAIVHRLVELHRGTVQVGSADGGGSEFVVRLPVASSRIALKPAGAAAPGSTDHPLRILMVDDVTDSAVSLLLLLSGWGHEVRMADDGASAVREAIELRPHVIFLDIGMPGFDGYEVAKWVRLQPNLRDVVLVAVTGYGQESDRKRSREAGFDHHLVKPAQPADMRRILDSVLEPAV